MTVNGQALGHEFGATGKDWLWEDGGVVQLPDFAYKIALHDMTGFNGRVDAIFITNDLDFTPPNDAKELAKFRHAQLKLPDDGAGDEGL